MYAMSAKLQGLPYVGVPLQADFALDEVAMSAAIAQHQPALVYLAYPNNPTGSLWDLDCMRRLIAQVAAIGGMVVLDEAYQPFASRSWIEEIHQDPQANAHVFLMRTLSKFGLAGVRLGYMLAPSALLAEIDKVRPPYNVSVLNAECALFALEHADVFAAQAAAIRQQRSYVENGLQAMPSITYWPSEANMILMRIEGEGEVADRVFNGLKAHGILVKNLSKMHPLLRNCLRITVGTEQENKALLTALKDIV
jgi:histidinol-phosphate aminotransferase